MANSYYQKYKERLRKEKKHMKEIKNFLKEKNTKGEKRPEKDIKILLKRKKKKSNKNLSEEQKEKLAEYRRNYCLTYNK